MATRARRAASAERRAARRVASNPVVDTLGRLGFWARAILGFSLAAVIAATLAGRSHVATDDRGAVAALAASVPGAALVALCAAAFAGHALWRWAEAAGGLRHAHGAPGIGKRAWFVAVGVGYAALSASCVSALVSRSSGSEEARTHEFASTMFGVALGRPLLGAVGAVLVGCGIGVTVWTITARFEDRLHVETMPTGVRALVRFVERPGQTARAALLLLVGSLLIRSAVNADPGQAHGLDGSVRTLAAHPLGALLLAAIAAGLCGFGVASSFEAAYLRTSGDRPRRRRRP